MINHLGYIDPGSGSYLIQALVAVAMGAAFFLKTSWWRIKMFFTKKKKDSES
jgi:hypothetical protein